MSEIDLSQPRKLPIRLGEHVILDLRDGAHHARAIHEARRAMLQVVSDKSVFDFATLGDEDKKSAMEFIAGIVSPEKSDSDGDRILRCGPMVTWDACAHVKNRELQAQRMEWLAELTGLAADVELARQIRSDNETMEKSEREPGVGGLLGRLFGDAPIVSDVGSLPDEIREDLEAKMASVGLAGRLRTENGATFIEIAEDEDAEEIQKRVESLSGEISGITVSGSPGGALASAISELLRRTAG